MIVRPEGERDARLCGVRIDWLASAFRVRFGRDALDNLEERIKAAKKHGSAGCDFAGDLWDLPRPRGGAVWLVSQARSERLEIAIGGAPGSYVAEDGEVVPGWTLALHASSAKLVVTGTRRALERAWIVARKAGIVFEGRARRLDLTSDVRGVLLGAVDELGWRPLAHVSTTNDNGKVADNDNGERSSGVMRILGDERLSPATGAAGSRRVPEASADNVRNPGKRTQLRLLPK